MEVTLLHHTPLWVCARAIRTCWSSHAKSDSSEGKLGQADAELIDRVGNKYKHSSTLEHIVLQFEIQGISRLCLQELARHRMASLSVKSTRYTLKELKNEPPFTDSKSKGEQTRASKYVVFTDNPDINRRIVSSLEHSRHLVCRGYSNDQIKYALPESYKTDLVWTINARSLQNFLRLRLAKSAHPEIRELAKTILSEIPENIKFLFNI